MASRRTAPPSGPTTYATLLEALEDTADLPSNELAAQQICGGIADVMLLVPALEAYIPMWKRTRARQAEQDFDDAVTEATVEEQPPVRKGAKTRRYVTDPAPAEAFHEMTRGTFVVRPGTRVPWADVTTAHIDERIEYLEHMGQGIQDSINRMKRVRRVLVKSGEARIGDINPEAMAKILAEVKDDEAYSAS